MNSIFSLNENSVKLSIGWKSKIYPIKDIVNGENDKDFKQIYEYAILSHNSYFDTNESTSDWKNHNKRFHFPKWKLVEGIPNFSSKKEMKKTGLIYEVYEKEENGNIITAIAFRGSEKQVKDWATNLRWFIPDFIWKDQYTLTRSFINPLVKYLNARKNVQNKNHKIVSTGHSLGGGLAQHVAYACRDINLVYAFDPSPVTGYYDIPRKQRIENKKNVKVLRIYEQGEFLAYARNPLRFFYPAPQFYLKDPRFVRLGYNFQKGNFAYQHSMHRFASNLHLKSTGR